MNNIYLLLFILLLVLYINSSNTEGFAIGGRSDNQCTEDADENPYNIRVSNKTCLDVWGCEPCCEPIYNPRGFIGCGDEPNQPGEPCDITCPDKLKYATMIAAGKKADEHGGVINWPGFYFNSECTKCNDRLCSNDVYDPTENACAEDTTFIQPSSDSDPVTGYFPDGSIANENREDFPCFCNKYTKEGDGTPEGVGGGADGWRTYCSQFTQQECCPTEGNWMCGWDPINNECFGNFDCDKCTKPSTDEGCRYPNSDCDQGEDCCYDGITYWNSSTITGDPPDVMPAFHLQWTRDDDNNLVRPPVCFDNETREINPEPGTDGIELCENKCTEGRSDGVCDVNICTRVVNAGLCARNENSHFIGTCEPGWPAGTCSVPNASTEEDCINEGGQWRNPFGVGAGENGDRGKWRCVCEDGWEGPLCDQKVYKSGTAFRTINLTDDGDLPTGETDIRIAKPDLCEVDRISGENIDIKNPHQKNKLKIATLGGVCDTSTDIIIPSSDVDNELEWCIYNKDEFSDYLPKSRTDPDDFPLNINEAAKYWIRGKAVSISTEGPNETEIINYACPYGPVECDKASDCTKDKMQKRLCAPFAGYGRCTVRDNEDGNWNYQCVQGRGHSKYCEAVYNEGAENQGLSTNDIDIFEDDSYGTTTEKTEWCTKGIGKVCFGSDNDSCPSGEYCDPTCTSRRREGHNYACECIPIPTPTPPPPPPPLPALTPTPTPTEELEESEESEE